jgi:hypothetical protein
MLILNHRLVVLVVERETVVLERLELPTRVTLAVLEPVLEAAKTRQVAVVVAQVGREAQPVAQSEGRVALE